MWIVLVILVFIKLFLGIVKDAILIFKNLMERGDTYYD